MKFEIKNRGRINPVVDVILIETKEIVRTFDSVDWKTNYINAREWIKKTNPKSE